MRYIDPPEGWKYGFPKVLPEEIQTEEIPDWMVSEGYPIQLIEEFGEYFYWRSWEEEDGIK